MSEEPWQEWSSNYYENAFHSTGGLKSTSMNETISADHEMLILMIIWILWRTALVRMCCDDCFFYRHANAIAGTHNFGASSSDERCIFIIRWIRIFTSARKWVMDVWNFHLENSNLIAFFVYYTEMLWRVNYNFQSDLCYESIITKKYNFTFFVTNFYKNVRLMKNTFKNTI